MGAAATARFIPAGAGNTVENAVTNADATVYPRWRGEHCRRVIDVHGLAVYPRWRGEHASRTSSFVLTIGLSPLARGTRIYPLHRSNGPTVYPRWRGEHSIGFWRISATSGLSPLARGTRSEASGSYESFRFIPAGAGNTGRCGTTGRDPTVYPRWRGEHFIDLVVIPDQRGLSPLARGTL
ncbi:hypothetical protein PEC301645_33470 [Pectobacterium carotovorum subsp. carotovorum]|nr:hypothetical protein PEC301645_33470 [Pectobacterium carotovorum subsp. carotovorum]